MKAIFVDKQTKQGLIFSCKSELAQYVNKSQSTILNWSRIGIMDNEKYLICFDVEERKNKKLVRKHYF